MRARLVAELEARHAEAERPAVIRAELARLDAEAEAARQRQARADAQARMDELARGAYQDLAEARAHYVALVTIQARHATRHQAGEGIGLGIPNRVPGFAFGYPEGRIVEIDNLLPTHERNNHP